MIVVFFRVLDQLACMFWIHIYIHPSSAAYPGSGSSGSRLKGKQAHCPGQTQCRRPPAGGEEMCNKMKCNNHHDVIRHKQFSFFINSSDMKNFPCDWSSKAAPQHYGPTTLNGGNSWRCLTSFSKAAFMSPTAQVWCYQTKAQTSSTHLIVSNIHEKTLVGFNAPLCER